MRYTALVMAAFLSSCLSRQITVTAPTDPVAMNRFANHYNRYSRELTAGQIDTRQWRKVQEAWQVLNGQR